MDAVIADLAGRQHGVVGRWQLLERGIGPDAIEHRVRTERLHVLHRGVYSVGHRALPREGRWIAAVLAGGPQAALSHRAAAALWGIRPGGAAVIEVTVPLQRRARHGIEWHVTRLPPDELTEHEGIRVTTVPRTLFDLAARVRPRELERALNEAEVLRLYDELSLKHLLTRYPGRPGTRPVRGLVERRNAGATLTRSELELRFLELVDAAGLPEPATNALVEGFEVDCMWRAPRVIVELDGHAFHSTPAAFERDRRRDRVLQAAGWRVVRVTARQLQHGTAGVTADLRGLLGRANLAP